MDDLDNLRNLGPVSRCWLREVGIHNREQLAAIGSVGAWELLHARGDKPSLNLVYAIEGALMDLPWTDLPSELRERLREQVAERDQKR